MISESNTTGRTFAIGDVHGCDVALENLLSQIAPSKNDTVVFLGDLVDRGPDPKKVVQRIMDLRDQCKVILVMGNHEEMMRGSLEGTYMLAQWLHFGGQTTLGSYGEMSEIPSAHLRFLFSGCDFYETEDHVFIHASLEPGVSMANQTKEFFRWKHLAGSERPLESGKRVICGHTAQKDGKPWCFDGWVCIDTSAYHKGWLSALDVKTNHVYQANQASEKRDFPLDDS